MNTGHYQPVYRGKFGPIDYNLTTLRKICSVFGRGQVAAFLLSVPD